MIEKLDLFQRPIPNFTIRGRSTISSPLGFFVSIFIILTAILFAAVLIIEFFGGENQYRTIQNLQKDYFVNKTEPFRGVTFGFGLQYNEEY
jgi:hypothetical protein